MNDDIVLLGEPCPDCGAESMVPCFVFCGSRFEDGDQPELVAHDDDTTVGVS